MKIRIGTRGSALALKQANIVKEKLCKLHPALEVEIVTIITSGDKIQDKNLADIGGKGLFIKEIEEQLLAKSIDIAVHSMKDMPAIMPGGFSIPCTLKREDARDVFVSTKYESFADLPQGAVIGTSSARRAAQALHLRPDLKIVPFRGNVNTRIKKIEEGEVDATFLAIAGINRLGIMEEGIMQPMAYLQMLPAVAQGAIGIEILENNNKMAELISKLNDDETYSCISAERSFMRVFEGSCATPIAAHAEISDNNIHLKCLIAKPDGRIIHRTSRNGSAEDATALGKDAAMELKKKAGDNFFA